MSDLPNIDFMTFLASLLILGSFISASCASIAFQPTKVPSGVPSSVAFSEKVISLSASTLAAAGLRSLSL